MYLRLMLCLLFLFGGAFGADVINVHGTVKSAAGTPVKGAILTLVGKDLKDTTDDQGLYLLTDQVPTIVQPYVPKSENISLNKGVLELNLPQSSPVKVEMFDVKGNLVKREVIKNALAGVYRLNLNETSFASNLLVIHASIGQHVTTLRYFPMNNGSSMMNSTGSSSGRVGGSLAKVMAISDTVKVTATGFPEMAVAITSYDTLLNITFADQNAVTVQLAQEKQPFEGFGINATIMPSGKSLPWKQLYSTDLSTSNKDALGLSILRIGMNENGSHRDVPSDWTTVRSVNPDVKVIGSCWSAPASWKTNNNVNHGGHLKPEYYSQWATKIAEYAKSNNLYAMGVSNEADFASGDGAPLTGDYPSMVYTGKEMVEFVKVAGPIFKQKAPGVKLISPEASLWIHVWSNISPTGKGVAGAPNGGYNSTDPLGCGCFSNDITEEAAAKCAAKCNSGDGYDYGHWLAADDSAWNQIDILGVHEYESQKAYTWPADVTGGKRDKVIYETEMSGVMYWPEQGPNTTIENGVAVGRWIQSGLMVGEASVWCYWWYEAYYSNDNEGLAIIQGSSTIAKRYYCFGNYSRYIRPGATIVNITGTDKLPAKVLLTAAKNMDGKVVIVAVNENTTEQAVEIAISGGTVPSSFTPIVTDKDNNWKEGTTPISVGTDGVLKATLGKMSVTTFVSK